MPTILNFDRFDSFENFKKEFSKNPLYRCIEVSMSSNKKKLNNIQSRIGLNNLIKYRAVVSVSGKKKYGEHGWTRNLQEALADRDGLEKNRPKQIYNNKHTVDIPKIRFGVIAEEFLNALALSANSKHNKQVQLDSSYFNELRDKYVHEITAEDLAWLSKSFKTQSTAEGYCRVIRDVLEFAEISGYPTGIKINKHSKISKEIKQLKANGNMSEKSENINWFTTEDILNWLAATKDILNKRTHPVSKKIWKAKTDLSEFQLNTPARCSEILALDKKKDFKFDKNGIPIKVHIQRQILDQKPSKIKGSRFDLPKYRRKRWMTLNKRAIEIYMEYSKIEAPLFVDINGDTYDLLFPGVNDKGQYDGSSFSQQGMGNFWQTLKSHPLMTKFKDVSIGTHILRHTKITHEAYLNRHDSYMREMLIAEIGHKDHQTLNTYIHIINEMNPKILEKNFSYFKHQHGKVLATENNSILAEVAEQYNIEDAIELLTFLRTKSNLEPTNSLNKLALTSFSLEQIRAMLDAIKEIKENMA